MLDGLDAVIAEIEDALNDPPRDDDEITIGEYAEAKGLSYSQARRYLEKGIKSGRLTKRQLKIGRIYKVVYRVVK